LTRRNALKRTVPILMTLLFTGASLTLPRAAQAAGAYRASPAVRKAALQERHRKVIQKLNLTPDQAKRIHEFRAGYRQRVAEINAKLHVKRVELENEMDKTNPDPERVKALTEEIGKLKAARDLEKLRAKRELDKILTPEQREELKRIEQQDPAGDAVTEVDPSGE
jgi:Spy/CpxP family protein refolding chaperone